MTDDAAQVAAMRDANWTPAVQYWRQKHDEARAEIERLNAENDRLHADRTSADQELVDQYRNPRSGIFSFPADVAAIIRRLDRAEAERDGLRDVIQGIEILTAVAGGLTTQEAGAIHWLAAEARGAEPITEPALFAMLVKAQEAIVRLQGQLAAEKALADALYEVVDCGDWDKVNAAESAYRKARGL